jgi:hypothetical protein
MTIDPRGEDPWTALAGTDGGSPTHCDILAAFLRRNDRPHGWTSGEIRDSHQGTMDHEEIHRRLADLGRDGRAYTTGETRRDPRTRGQQRAWRAGALTAAPPAMVPAPSGGPPMLLPPCVLWMDPGMITGLAWLWLTDAGLPPGFHTDEYPFAEVGDHVEDTCRRFGQGLVLGYETYKVRPNMPQTNARDAMEPIGVLRHYGLRYGCRIVHADPGDRLVMTRAILTAFGWWPKGKKDAASATQHLAAWCLRENCLPTRERAIMSAVVSTL